jgi:hypothetical protein
MGVEFAATPFCPAGHLPHGWGDRHAATFRPSFALRVKLCQSAKPISLLVGEMPGRAEGGSHTLPTPPASSSHLRVNP